MGGEELGRNGVNTMWTMLATTPTLLPELTKDSALRRTTPPSHLLLSLQKPTSTVSWMEALDKWSRLPLTIRAAFELRYHSGTKRHMSSNCSSVTRLQRVGSVAIPIFAAANFCEPTGMGA